MKTLTLILHIRFRRLLAFALLLLFSMAAGAAADTASVHQNALLSHGLFKSTHWRLTGDTLDWRLPASFTAHTPEASRGAGLGDTDRIVFSSGSSLYIMKASLSEGYIFTAEDPVLLAGLDGTRPFDCLGTAGSDTIIVASATGVGAVQVLWLSAAGVLFVRDTAWPGAGIQAVDLFRDAAGAVNLRVGGTSGLLRSMVLADGLIGSVADLDVDAAQTITALADSLAGSSDGSIWNLAAGSSSLNSRPATEAIRSINRGIAVGDNGCVLVADAGIWRPFVCGTRSWRAANLIGCTDGQGVELLDSTMYYEVHTLALDRPTVMSVRQLNPDTPVTVADFAYEHQSIDTLEFSLSDADGNALCPRVFLDGYAVLTTASPDGSGALVQSLYPDTMPTPGLRTLDPAGTSFRLILRPDSIVLSAVTRVGVMDPFSYWKSWQNEEWVGAAAWSDGSICQVMASDRIFKISANSVTLLKNAPAGRASLSIHVGQGEILLSFPLGSTSTFALVDLSGRQVVKVADMSSHAQCRVPTAALASGMYCAQFESTSGLRSTHLIQIVR